MDTFARHPFSSPLLPGSWGFELIEAKEGAERDSKSWRKEGRGRLLQRFILARRAEREGKREGRRILFTSPPFYSAGRYKVFYDGSPVPTAPLLNGIRAGEREEAKRCNRKRRNRRRGGGIRRDYRDQEEEEEGGDEEIARWERGEPSFF